jgi:M6 family metalloprotease-like protein
MSAPFVARPFTFTNPDGTKVPVIGTGNQHAAVFETPEGFTVVEDPATGFFHYATVAADRTALVPSGVRVGRRPPAGLDRHLRVTVAGRRSALAGRDGQLNRWEERRLERRAQRSAGGQRAATLHPAPSGDILGLCVMVDFPDVAGTLTRQQVDDFCNLPGYSEFGNSGSVFDYFNDVSGGELRYRNLVVDYVTAGHERSYYTDEGEEFATRAKQLAVEVLTKLKNRGFDFDDLSVDGRAVYALNIFYAGDNVNNFRQGLWPHQSTLFQPFDITPNVPPPLPGVPRPTPLRYLADYQLTDMGSALSLGTFCHENGHMVCDFPDLYDVDGPDESKGAGAYCLMAYGGALSNKNPTQVSAYLKYTAGWATQVREFGNGDVETIQAGQNDFLIHRKDDSEYFILENRQATGRDSSLPDVGLLIWHVDEHGSQKHEQMTSRDHYELSLEQADGRFDLERAASYGDRGDLFGVRFELGELGVTHRHLLANSRPPLERWASNPKEPSPLRLRC